MSRASLFSFCNNYSGTDVTHTPRDSPYLARVFGDPRLDEVWRRSFATAFGLMHFEWSYLHISL
jgi:hypothetical protein